MLLKFFKRPLPFVLISIIILGILIWLNSFLSGQNTLFYFDKTNMPLYKLIVDLIGGGILIGRIVAFSLVIISALFLIQLNTKHILIKYRTYLPALFFILLSSSFLPLQRINPAIFATLFIILTIDNLFSAYDANLPLNNFFKAGFWVAIASLFYFPAFFYLLFVFLSIIILKPINLRDLLVTISGFLAPWFLFFIYNYLVFDDLSAITKVIETVVTPIESARYFGIPFTIFYSFSGLLLLITLAFLFGSLSVQKISARKFHSIFLLCLAFSAAIVFLWPYGSIEITYISSIPAAFIFANYFTFAKSRFWTELLFSFLLGIALVMQFY